MKLALYAHGGSGNHGCEALVRSTIKVIGTSNDFSVFSERADEDMYYQLNKLATIHSSKDELSTGLNGLLYKIRMKLGKDERIYYRNIYRSFLSRLGNVDWAVAIGGDNYCYQGFLEQFGVLNELLAKKKIPAALWGCSIDPYRINSVMLEDLKKYRFITARESITFNALKEHGLTHVHLIPDSAFVLDKIEKDFPDVFDPAHIVGINLSPLISGYEKHKGMAMANYDYLIQYILQKTDFTIALIPHVVWSHNDDRLPLRTLYEKYQSTGRILLLEDNNAMVLKGYISRCRFLIAARTHASIAGYSTGVPTLVVGYSVKARGIATDLFGTDQNYVIPVDSLSRQDELTIAFQWLVRHEEQIRNYYSLHLTDYISRLKGVQNLFNE